MNINYGKCGLLLGGALLGSYGVKILGSRPMKKLYTHITAAVLCAKDEVVKDFTVLSENCSDIYADAKDINEEKAAKLEQEKLEAARALIAAAEEAPEKA